MNELSHFSFENTKKRDASIILVQVQIVCPEVTSQSPLLVVNSASMECIGQFTCMSFFTLARRAHSL